MTPQDKIHDLWFRKPLRKCVKVIAAPHGCDYYDAIVLGEKLASDPLFFLEGGAKNVARRDGMGTTILSCVEKKDEYIMLNCTGGGTLGAISRGFVHKEPDLVLSPDLPPQEIVKAVKELF